MLPRLPKVALVLGVLLALAGREIVRLRAALDAKPIVELARVDERTEDVRRGKVKISRSTVTAPDGTKTTTSTREIGPVKSHIEAKTAETRKETPVTVRRARRWGYLDFNPVSPTPYVPVAGRLGMDLVGDLGAGAWYYRPGNAFGITVGGRF